MHFDRWTIEAGRLYKERTETRARLLEFSEQNAPASPLTDAGNFPIEFLDGGKRVSQAVGRIRIKDNFGLDRGLADGVLLEGGILVTPHQTLPYSSWANHSYVEFFADGYAEQFRLVPKEHFSTDANLDITKVAVSRFSESGKGLETVVPIELAAESPEVGNYLSLVHFPGGKGPMISLRCCQVIDVLEDRIHLRNVPIFSYGGALFNDAWQLVGIIHAGIPVIWEDDVVDASGACIGAEAMLAKVFAPEQLDAREQGLEHLLKDLGNLSQSRAFGDALEEGEKGYDSSVETKISDEDADLIASLTSQISEELRSDADAEQETHAIGHDPEFLGENNTIFMPLLDPAHQAGELGTVTLPYTKHTILYDKDLRIPRIAVIDIHGEQLGRQTDLDALEVEQEPRLKPNEQIRTELLAEVPHTKLVDGEVNWGKKAALAIVDLSTVTNVIPGTYPKLEEIRSQYLDNLREEGSKAVALIGPILHQEQILSVFIILARTNAQGEITVYAVETRQDGSIHEQTVQNIGLLTGFDFGRLLKAKSE